MPVTLTNDLPVIAFSRNPILVNLSSDDYIQNEGAQSTFNIVFKAAITAGQLIHLQWANAVPLIFTAAVTPDDSGLQFPTGDGSANYVSSLVEVFKANYYIDRDFKVTTSSSGSFPCLQLSAFEDGVVYNIAEADETNVMVESVLPGVNEDILPNFQHILEVFLIQASNTIKIYDNKLQLEPQSGVSVKDIAPILNSYISFPKVSDKPAYAINTWQPCENTTARYYIKYGQYYGSLPTAKKIKTTGSAVVTSGGLAVQSALGQTIAGFIRPENVNQNTICLRQGSKVKAVQQAQPEWLYWLNLTGNDIVIKLQIDIYYSDGTRSKFSTATITAEANGKYYIGSGYNQINISGNSLTGKTCSYYTARVVGTTGVYLSVLYTYVLDTYKEFPRYFVYLNSLGGYQTLYTYGRSQFETDRTKDDLVRQVNYPEQAVTGKQLEANIRLQDKCTINTGYKTSREISLLRDFLASPEKYWYYKGDFIPIGVSSDNIKQPADAENLPAAQFIFNPLYDEFVYTDDMNQPDEPNNAPGQNIFVLMNKDGSYLVTVPDGNKILIT